jgi:hypothetical protein
VKPIFWIYLILNVMAVLGFFAYLISRAREAAKNPEFFKMKEREKDIHLAKRFVGRHKKYKSSIAPDIFFFFQTSVCLFLIFSDSKLLPLAIIMFIPTFLLCFWPVTFTIEKDSFSFTHFIIFTRKFFFKDLKRIKIRYIQSYRGNSSYTISIFDQNLHFSKSIFVWNESMLHMCFIDAAFRSNPNIEMEIVESNHQPMLELQDLMLARKPLGIFQDD